MESTMGTPDKPTLAFIYDRNTTETTAALDERLERCQRYAVEHGWVTSGLWVDRGDHALTNWPRPEWYRLACAMQQAAAPAVCLVESWERISRERDRCAILRLAVHQAGGYCVTAAGEDDRELRRGRISVTAPLALRGRP
jgi:hypothetical protein